MPSTPSESGLHLLLDEHYPGWLADELTASGVDTVSITGHHLELRGAPDDVVLAWATDEGRVVVTEDVTTFAAAIALVPAHVGVVFCHHGRFPRTRSGLAALRVALIELADEQPHGLGAEPIVWWLPAPGGG